MEKFFAFISYRVISFLIGVVIMVLLSYVIKDIALLYEVEIVNHLTQTQVLGTLFIGSLFLQYILKKLTKEQIQEAFNSDKPSMSIGKSFGYGLIISVLTVLWILIVWAIAYLTHWVIV